MSNEVFENAHKAFIATLSDSDRTRYRLSACASVDDIEKTLRGLECMSRQGQKRSLNRCLRIFKKLNERLQPYFDALNVIASAEDNVAFAYGAFRIILQLASAFPTFLEKLMTTIERLADTFPQYDAITKIFEGHLPVRMRMHLEKVYGDLFCFLNTASKIFTASSGRVKRPVGMIASVIWTPFDSRFNDILNRMDSHRNFILVELEIHQAQQARDAERAAVLERSNTEKERERAEQHRQEAHNRAKTTEDMKHALLKEAKESSIQRILDWLAPPSFVKARENSQEQREEGTAQWIFEDAVFENWKTLDVDLNVKIEWDKMPPWVLWVHGNPGCGKTVLASSVIDEIVEGGDWNDKANGACYFFFKYGDPSSSTLEAAYRSVLAQILHQQRDDIELLDKFLFARLTSSGQLSATYKELFELIRVCASNLGQLTLILDGIDESKDPDTICIKLKDLVTSASVKLICFSRPNVNSLQTLVENDQRVGFNRSANELDIRIYLMHRLQELMRERKLSSLSHISNLVDILVYGADGMFLWAKLMARYLSCPALSPTLRENTIRGVHFPEGLHQMYDRIFLLIHQSATPSRDLARRVILWIMYSIPRGQTLYRELLQSAVTNHNDSHEWDDFASVVISVCGGLVEHIDSRIFRFTHLTVHEYLSNNPWSRIGISVPFIPKFSTAATEMTLQCIQYLLNRAPKKPPTKFSRYFDLSLVYDYKRSFEAYAAGYWGKHLKHTIAYRLSLDSQDSDKFQTHITLVESIRNFLEDPLVMGFWIECVYKSQRTMLELLEDIDEWSQWVIRQPPKLECWAKTQEVAKRLLVISSDLRSLDKDWSPKLLGIPSLIWDDVMVFQKIGAIAEIAAATDTHPITVMTPIDPKNEDGERTQCLCSTSRTSEDGKMVGVLSVYCSSGFDHFWRTMHHDTAYKEIENFSSGWIAKYELWSPDSKLRLASLDICLPAIEVQILLRQSARQDPFQRKYPFKRSPEPDHQTFEISFPTAISPDCLSFAILRMIHNVRPDLSAATAVLRSLELPLDFFAHFGDKWTNKLKVFDPNEFGHLPKAFFVSWQDWYSYSISFSPSGKHLCFVDYQAPGLTHLAVFEILQKPRFSTRLLQWTQARMERVKETVFHPGLPLLALSSDSTVFIWTFSKDTSKPIQLQTQSAAIKSISFSLCGRFLLATNERHVDVLPIPEHALAHQRHLTLREGITQDSFETVDHESRYPSYEEPRSATECDTVLDLEKARLPPNGVISGAHLLSVVQGFEPSQKLLLTNINNEVELKVVGHDDTRYKLLSMPISFDTRDTTLTIKAPVKAGDQLQIMFDKKAAQGYSLSDGKQAQFPAMVERKLTSIVRVSDPTPMESESHRTISNVPRLLNPLQQALLLKHRLGDECNYDGLPRKRLRREEEQLLKTRDVQGYRDPTPLPYERVKDEVITERAYKKDL